jgi:hypothetical protein
MSAPHIPLSGSTLPSCSQKTGRATSFQIDNQVTAHLGLYRIPKQSEEEPDLYVHLRHCQRTGQVHQCIDDPIPGDWTQAKHLEWAAFLSRLTGAKLQPAQDGTPFVYDYVPRTSEEVDRVEQFLSDLVWIYDEFPRAEEDHYASPAYGHDHWPQLLRKAHTIREKYNLPEQKPWTDPEWAGLKKQLELLRWLRGDSWDSLAE